MGRSRVLVVEDNPVNRRLAVEVLRAVGYEVVEAAGAPEARDHLAGSLPECIVLDVRLSDADGLALIGELRADRRTAAIPIVVTTALAMRTDRERILQVGVDAYLAKPFSPGQLRQVVGDLLKGRRDGAEAPRG
jgi:CheY-like chemotaxis protein